MTKEGTFQKCTKCKEKLNCCQLFDKLNSPSLSEEEVNIIKEKYTDFLDNTCNNTYTIKTINNTCIFYKNNKCEIYDIRPLDCRLYPFDIIEKENKYYLILYKLTCNNKSDYINDIKDIDIIIEKIKPWIKEFTNPTNFTKMKNQEYIVIKEINNI
jgi:Fe-S-cluster containining protein